MINWDAVGAVGEILGAMAVVASLMYLALQIRTQNREARIASVHEITEAFRNAIAALQDADRAQVYVSALDEFDELGDVQRLQFISMVHSLLRVWEEAYYQFKRRSFGPATMGCDVVTVPRRHVATWIPTGLGP